MSKPIKAGDLVQVVRDCCGDNLGITFVVEYVYGPRRWRCTACQFENDSKLAYRLGAKEGLLCHAPLPWLKRIPPLGELAGLHSEDEMDIFDFREA